MRPPMRNKLSILVLIHADVETTEGLTNSSRFQGDSNVAPESLKHRIWIEVSLSKSMPAPDEAYDVPMFLSRHDSAGGSYKPTLERPCRYGACTA
jgi:hypothetical protein